MNSKKLLALLLSALMLTSTFVACDSDKGKETDAGETSVTETTAPEETVNPDLVTENGEAAAHIVVAEGADALLTYAAEELVYHVEKVSGAVLPVVTTAADGLAIVIATPDTCPALNEMFPEDIAWLGTLEEGEKRYGSDGFAIRRHENTLYIFGITERGTLNGVYDFIEENMGVLWIRASEDIGLVYDEMPTVTVTKADYREKSPFEVRGWNLCCTTDRPMTDVMLSRNKMNALLTMQFPEIGISNVNLNHNAKRWVQTSPMYDETVTEYWCTDREGNPMSGEESPQINFWSELTMETVAASMIASLDANYIDNIGLGIEDNEEYHHLPESGEPFEYAPGQFVNPDDPAYFSTVFFTFLNKVAERVNAVYPEVKLNAYSYWLTETPPLCPLADSIVIVIAPITECSDDPIDEPITTEGTAIRTMMDAWNEVAATNDIIVYNYYGCCGAMARYERPIWNRIETELRYYAESGFAGVLPEGVDDNEDARYPVDPVEYNCADRWEMGMLTFWLIAKLSWNPEEDTDALIVEFCDKVYGNASPYMQEYYRLIEQGWVEGDSESGTNWRYTTAAALYLDVFVYQVNLEEDILTALRSAYEAAETEVIKERIRPIKESYEAEFPEV